MSELIFQVNVAPEGGFTARALGADIFAEADSWAELKTAIKDAVLCHFDEGTAPGVVRLHRLEEEVIAI